MRWPSVETRFRVVVVAAQVLTFVVTWNLWSDRPFPPPLPATGLAPAIHYGWPLVLASLSQLRFPRAGTIASAVLLTVACAADETRLQPQLVSFLFLGAATWPGEGARFVGRAHLLILWAWAGALKLLSPRFLTLLGPKFVTDVWPEAPPVLATLAGGVLAGGELLLAGVLLVPRFRRWAPFLTIGMHVGILGTLAAGPQANASIWPWNFVLALSGAALFAPWRRPFVEDFARQSRAVRALVLSLALVPIGWHVGLVDGYLSHHLYSVDVPVPDAPSKPFRATWRLLGVPIPPEQRLFDRFFDLTCQPGEQLTVVEYRALFAGERVRECPRERRRPQP